MLTVQDDLFFVEYYMTAISANILAKIVILQQESMKSNRGNPPYRRLFLRVIADKYLYLSDRFTAQ